MPGSEFQSGGSRRRERVRSASGSPSGRRRRRTSWMLITPEVFQDPIPIEPGTMIGDYRVERKLDEGGMGTVYAGVHPVIGKKVAIKLLHPHVARQEESVYRFIQEARAVNAIGHPGIVDIFGFGKFDDGRHYIVMEYLEGQQLLDYMNEHGPLTPFQACPVVRQMAESLSAAHQKAVVHRDLKPENVFLMEAESTAWPPRIKLLDFGLAKLLEDELQVGPNTRMGATVGTPYYMAPEQCRGRKVDARSDVYALGVMFFEMITGRVPFYAEEAVDVLYMHITQDPEPPSTHTPVPGDIEKLIMDCMAKAPELRPQSMNAVIAQLDAIEAKRTDQDMEESERKSLLEELVAHTAEILGDAASDPGSAETSAASRGGGAPAAARAKAGPQAGARQETEAAEPDRPTGRAPADSPLSISHFSEPSSASPSSTAEQGAGGPAAAAVPSEVVQEPQRSATEYSYSPGKADRATAPKTPVAVPADQTARAATQPTDETTQQVHLLPGRAGFSHRLIWLAIGILAGLAAGVALGLWVLGK